MNEDIVTDVPGCSRCGLDHTNVRFAQLQNPIVLDSGTSYTYWSVCPSNGEPLLMTPAVS